MPVSGANSWVRDLYNTPSGSVVAEQIGRLRRWATEPASAMLNRSFGRGLHAAADAAKIASGWTYASGAVRHTARYFGRRPQEVGWFGRYMPRTKRAASAAGVALTGLLGPGFIVGFGAMSPHGALVGMAEETAGFVIGGLTFAPSIALGKIAGRRIGASLGAGIARSIPFLRHVPGLTATAGRVGFGIGLAGGTIAGFGLGLLWWEAARYSVGFALHTLPTFARQFQSDMEREGFGGDYTDTAGAATMRQRSLQVMGKSFANARSALGQEASLLHV